MSSRIAATTAIAAALLAVSFSACAQTSKDAANQSPSDNTLYVSPTGDDANPGTQDKPLRTIEHARDLLHGHVLMSNTDFTVILEAGTYRLSSPLTLDAADSGTDGHNVIYKAAPNAQVIISGALPVIGWKQIDADKNLWSASAPDGLKNTRQLYVDGVRALRTHARSPVKLTETATGYTAGSDVMSHWKNPGDIEFVYTGGNSVWSEKSSALGDWTEPRIPVASISGTEITMAQPCWNNSTKRVPLPATSRFKRSANLVGPASVGKSPEYVENAYELLGTPGEFYLDRSTNTFYYTPRLGEDLATADVEAPTLESLIIAHGTPAKPIHNLIFSGIQFSYAAWLFPSSPEGFSEIQANYLVTGPDGYSKQGLGDLVPGGKKPFGAWTKTPGNVSFEYAHHIQFINDDFVHLGAAGLELGHGSQENLVQGCTFTDISANGLELGGVDLPEANAQQVVRDNQILNNHFYNTATEFHGGVAIDVGYSQRTHIAHNQIDHQPYTGISLGWGGWPDKIEQAGVPNVSENALVEKNLIFKHLQLLADGGGIYTQGLTGPSLKDGEKLIGNFIHDQFSTGHGIYTDNGCKNVTADDNVLFHTNHDNWGGRHKDWYPGSNGKVFDAFEFSGNYWQQGETDSPPDTTLRNNHVIKTFDQAPEALRGAAGLESAYTDILKKHFAKPAAPEAPTRVAVAITNGTAYVTFNPPSNEGGEPIQSYTITASTGQKITLSSEDFWNEGYAAVEHVPTDSSLTFTVTATNANGTSVASVPSIPIQSSSDAKKPSTPNEASAYPGDGMASIHFQPAASTGNAPIIAYSCVIHPGDRKVMFIGRNVVVLSGKHITFTVVDGLENGKSYTFDIAAVSSVGEGPAVTTKPITPQAGK